ncbi:hypothetical protein M3I54_42290 [Paraburkholderia sp. CNPSo 3274]|uniref:hypothetical protein n=1 Tax=Paraburkholderia sp. CNPSo 3274 TaxID=2940932 RepID=UPI0020B7847F|nr:hypothetical protein [Paraburkholderia sp. CNPSo 3274]MCP3713407.1 hypothetical protein [Paraburkholderia sp. CNPSo 3274]
MTIDTAFALAGLGGFNAHGAGFLQAALDNRYRPDLITATSGQILVLANYLAGKKNLRDGLIQPGLASDPFAQLQTALFGYKGVFRPAFREAYMNLLAPPSFSDSLIDIFSDRLFPAQQYVPSRPDYVIEDVVGVLNSSDIGAVFNAYDPASGTGVLYGNDVARDHIKKESSIPIPPKDRPTDVRYAPEGKTEDEILPITAESIKSALWLSLYGFDGLPGGRMDGAYHRSCIVSELHSFSRVIVVRPLANGWLKSRLPRSWFDVQDWQCEMWFSVGYKAEVDAMKRINQLLRDGYILDNNNPKKFKIVDLLEVEPTTPAGYFNYFVEREAVFEASRVESDALFKRLNSQSSG